MSKKLVIYLVVSCILFIQCKEELNEDNFQINGEKLVLIYSYISPEADEIVVQVSESKSIFDPDLDTNLPIELIEEQFVIEDAIVEITNENGERLLINYDEDRRRYIEPIGLFSIVPGERYTLEVTTRGTRYSSSCIIPAANVAEEDINLNLIEGEGLFGPTQDLIVSFDDIDNETNFYIIGAEFSRLNDEFGSVFDLYFQNIYVSDLNKEGLLISDRGEGIGNPSEDIEVIAKVSNVDRFIYETFRSNYLNDINNGDLFYQPIVPPSNIQGENGYGVFGGYRLTEKTEVFEFN